MEAVKIRLYQNMVNYRRELSYGYVQTYPLPTPSMIRGMVHALLGFTEYHNLKISIQGDYETIITNMQKVYKFDRVRDDKKKGVIDSRVRVKAGGTQKSLNTGVIYVDLINNLKLIIHIQFSEEEYHQPLVKAMQKQLVILGRNEDIARVDDVKIITYEEKEEFDFELKYNVYLQKDLAKWQRGTAYRLPFYYRPVTESTDKRIFTYVDVSYITKTNFIEDKILLIDEEGDLISFMGVPIE